MSYQVLARKWRPKSFATLVGQEHVVRALSHALDSGRLHHAWLFTGTRGVGKTTISRILAKALNCEQGVSAEPCDQCEACRAIDADRFPDYIEMDAASNRGVDDMAALLDQAVYAPVQGRYKVYMIDEVHMLTGHAFNAMLKTLEEPPAHLKFILATTDPQKIPVTVLSRCLQFNLKQMSPAHISEHLASVLRSEEIDFEPAALRQLARAAAGSMRDALSLLDQAIAHGGGSVSDEQVSMMLGTVGDEHLHGLLDALVAADVAALAAIADGMEARSLSFEAALQALASLFQAIALVQFAPEAIADAEERACLQHYASCFDAEFLQLAYQISIHARDELSLAPDEYTGFIMCLLRLHAFRPQQPTPLGSAGTSPAPGGQSRSWPAAAQPSAVAPPSAATATPTENPAFAPPVDSAAPLPVQGAASPLENDEMPAAQQPQQQHDLAAAEAFSSPSPAGEGADLLAAGAWRQLIRAARLSGLVRELAQHCQWQSYAQGRLCLRLAASHGHLLEVNPTLRERLQEALMRYLQQPLQLTLEVGVTDKETPAQSDELERQQRQQAALEALETDPLVRELIERFDASVLKHTVKPCAESAPEADDIQSTNRSISLEQQR